MPQITTSVKLKIDTRQWQRMERRLLSGGDRSVQVGWWNSEHPSGVPTAQVAAWNEEGHMNGGIFAGTVTPARPFIRTGFMPHSKNIVKTYYGDINDVAMGRTTWTKFYKTVGEQLVKIMQETIFKWETPANSTTTIALKGFNNPLVETGYMQNSVKYKIVRRGANQ
jgi:hypothetical protein